MVKSDLKTKKEDKHRWMNMLFREETRLSQLK